MGAYLAAEEHPDKQFTMITFGQPRVGNSGFRDWTESLENFSQWRAVNEFDVIARTPYNWVGYKHAGHLIQLEEEDKTLFYYKQRGEGDYAGAPSIWFPLIIKRGNFIFPSASYLLINIIKRVLTLLITLHQNTLQKCMSALMGIVTNIGQKHLNWRHIFLGITFFVSLYYKRSIYIRSLSTAL